MCFNMIIRNNKRGFTLIEALVVIAIIGILSVTITANYSSMRYKFALLRSAHQLSQDIRRAQEMATSAKKYEPTNQVPPGYGIYLIQGVGQTSYTLYADTSPLQGNQQYDKGQDAVVETFNLEEKVYIIDISSSTTVSINFKGPDPVTRIYNGSSNLNSVTITLALEHDSNITKEVTVNKVGLIYVQ